MSAKGNMEIETRAQEISVIKPATHLTEQHEQHLLFVFT